MAVKSAGFNVDLADIHIEKTKELAHGHFSTNVAMILAHKVGKSPRKVAELIQVRLTDDSIEKVDIAGPGFINLFEIGRAHV